MKSAAPISGYVDVGRIEMMDPRISIVLSLDRAIAVSKGFQDARNRPVSDGSAEAYIDQVSELGNVKVRNDLRGAQQRNLAEVGETLIGELGRRLDASDKVEMEALRSERQAQKGAEFSAAVTALQNQADAAANEDSVDSARVATLKMQITAMQLNQNPPPTAPKGYWAALQTTRQSELDNLIKTFGAALNQIYARRDAMIAQERVAINEKVENDLTAAQQNIRQQRDAKIARAAKRFQTEQENLNSEDDRLFQNAESLVLPDLNGQDQAVQLAEATPALDENAAALSRDRSRLEASILADAYATVTAISKELHMKIVRKRADVPDVTTIVIDSIKDRNWKLS